MLRFENWPPQPDTTFVTEDTLNVIGDWMDSIAGRVNTRYHVARGIADFLHANVDGGNMSPERGQAFIDAITPQIPDTSDRVGQEIRQDLQLLLTKRREHV